MRISDWSSDVCSSDLAENRSAHDRIIFFCDVERPLRPRWLGYLNRAVSGVLGRATATQNLASDRVGVVNRLYGAVHWLKQRARALKHFNRKIGRASCWGEVCTYG